MPCYTLGIMKNLILLLILAAAIIFLFVSKNRERVKVNEKDLLKIHISGKRTR
jgi:hypothetical protein